MSAQDPNFKEAIVLAGGLGTRLRSVLPDLPKCMAPVDGKPFLSYLIDYFQGLGIGKFIFALGYKSNHFEDFLREKFSAPLPGGQPAGFELSIEKEPLGTGGAIKLALTRVTERTLLALHGAHFFLIN